MDIPTSILVSKNTYCNILKMFHVKQFINYIEFIIKLNFQDLYNTPACNIHMLYLLNKITIINKKNKQC